MLAIISLISLYFFLNSIKAVGIVAKAAVNKSKDSVASNIKARAACIIFTPVILLVVVKVCVAFGIIAIHKIIDLAELAQSIISTIV